MGCLVEHLLLFRIIDLHRARRLELQWQRGTSHGEEGDGLWMTVLDCVREVKPPSHPKPSCACEAQGIVASKFGTAPNGQASRLVATQRGATEATMDTADASFAASGAPASQAPPRPPLVFHVGVTGHRPDPNKRPPPDIEAVGHTIRRVLELIRDAVDGVAQTHHGIFDSVGVLGRSPARRVLRLLSSLAEGADQWVAAKALELGYELHAVLPFARAEYAKDFQTTDAQAPDGPRRNELEHAHAELHRLLENAESTGGVLELDGTRANNLASRSYLAAGRQVVQQADLLVAVWDGKEEKGVGGAGQIVREALQSGVPVVWIRWAAGVSPGQWEMIESPQWQILERPADVEDAAKRLQDLVAAILLPPDLSPNRGDLPSDDLRSGYYKERQRNWTLLGGLWGFFVGILSSRIRGKTDRFRVPRWSTRLADHKKRTYLNITEKAWNEEVECSTILINSNTMKVINGAYLHHYAWANQLSVFYGSLHRSSFVLNYILGALAVFFALLGIPALIHHEREWGTILAELVMIIVIIGVTRHGRRHRWHERWMEYRTLAERLRLSRLMALLGGWRQQSAMPGHLATYGDPINSWVHWHYRAVERAAGLASGAMDSTRLQEIQAAFHHILARGQVGYHADNAGRLDTVDHRLHVLGTAFFVGSFVACLTHLGLELGLPGGAGSWAGTLVILNALLPACGAATAAIRNQGEFQRLVRRSKAMKEAMEKLALGVSMISPSVGALKSQDLRRVAERIAQLMLNETLDWKVVFQDRPLVLPA